MYCNAGECSCRFKTSILINSTPLRISVIRSVASWFGKCDCSSKSLAGAAESRRHKDGWGSSGRTIPRIVFYDLLSTAGASFQYPRAAKRRILRPLLRPPSSRISYSPLSCRPAPLLPSRSSFLLLSFRPGARELPLFALSSPNGRVASILTSALRIYFGPVP